MWTYRARPHRVIDADTLEILCDLGFDTQHIVRVRLAAVDAPEMNTPQGKAARTWVFDWLGTHNTGSEWPLLITTRKVGPRDKYGRWVALIYAGTECLNTDILKAGHANPWPKPPTSPETNSVGNAPTPEPGKDTTP